MQQAETGNGNAPASAGQKRVGAGDRQKRVGAGDRQKRVGAGDRVVLLMGIRICLKGTSVVPSGSGCTISSSVNLACKATAFPSDVGS